MNPKVVIAAVVVLLLAAGGAYYFLYHNGSDAVSTGSAEKPLDSLDIGADDGALRAFYVKVGGEVSVKNYEDDDVTVTVESAQGAGISVSDKGASGTAAEGVTILTLHRTVGEDLDEPLCIIIGVR